MWAVRALAGRARDQLTGDTVPRREVHQNHVPSSLVGSGRNRDRSNVVPDERITNNRGFQRLAQTKPGQHFPTVSVPGDFGVPTRDAGALYEVDECIWLTILMYPIR